jgi:hypothetical protein
MGQIRLWVAAIAVVWMPASCQELEPRAYSVSPVGVNFAVLGLARSSGDLSFDPTLPIEEEQATLKAVAAGYGRSLGVLGRSASMAIAVPYIWGPLQGRVSGEFQSIYRSGLGDPTARFSINLWGAPAMNTPQFAKFRQRTTIGASIVVQAPLGQYDPNKLINIGSNRWAGKPELGISRRIGRWYLDFYGGVWIFSKNSDFRGAVRTQNPIASGQFHLSYNIRPRMWAAFDANFYSGGRTAVNGIPSTTLQRNSRVGGTFAFPLDRHSSFKISASTGAVTTIGAAFTTIAIAYQRLWGAGL